MNIEPAGRVLVTGATGFLGGALVRHLRARGHDVIAQGRDAGRLAQLRAEGIATLAWPFETALTEDQMRGLGQLDAIVHAAALSAPFGRRADFMRANVGGTKSVIALAERLGANRFVFVSSPSVYFALQDQLDVTEASPLPRPFNHYAHSKVLAEKLVRAAAIPSRLVLRPRGIYGPGETTLLPRLLRAAQKRPLPAFRGGVARIDLTYIDDVVAAVTAALTAEATVTEGTYNVSGGEVLPIRDIVEQCCAMAGVAVRWRPMRLRPALVAAHAVEHLALLGRKGKEPAFTRYGLALFAFQQSLNIGRIRKDLGWSPKVAFRDGLARSFQEPRAWH